MKDVRSRRDRIASQETGQSRLLRSSHHAQCRRLVAGDVPVLAGRQLGRTDIVTRVENFCRFAQVVACLQRPRVRLGNRLVPLELIRNPGQCRLHRTVVHPVEQTQRVEVLAASGLLCRKASTALSVPRVNGSVITL